MTKNNFFSSFRELVIFAVPIMLGQLSQMLIGAGDIAVASRHSDETLSAIGLAVAFTNPIFVAGMGFIVAVSPIIAKKRGEGKSSNELLWSVVLFALLLSIPFMIFSYLTYLIVPLFNYNPVISDIIVRFLKITALSFPGVFVFLALKEFFQAEEKVFLPNILSIVAVILNLLLGFLFVFGNNWFPAIGADGLAWASVTVRYFLGISLLLIIFNRLKNTPLSFDKEFIKEIIQLGFPMCIAFFFEVMAFCMVSILAGQLGIVPSAANNIILTVASITFMIPLAISSAVSVKVGHAYGEKNNLRIQSFAWAAIAASIGYMSLSALVMTLFPQMIVLPFGASPEVVVAVSEVLFIVAMFQIFDGAQVTFTGVLRGIGISKITTITTFIGYWVIGLPLGYYLTHYQNMGIKGFWTAQAMAIMLVGIALFIKLKMELNKNEFKI